MLNHSWLNALANRFANKAPRGTRRRRPFHAASFEVLETRVVLSGTNSSNINMGANGMYLGTIDVSQASTSTQITYLSGNGLQFNFTAAAGMPQFAIDGFMAAANIWSSILTDDIVVNIDIDYSSLPPNVIGGTLSTSQTVLVSDYLTALLADGKSLTDLTASGFLPPGTLSLLTTDPITGNTIINNGSTALNTTLNVNTALAKAVGVRAAGDTATDGSITFSSAFPFDFDPTDGIDFDKIDFTFVAVHEIGHALGFVSGVDDLEFFVGTGGDPTVESLVTPLDLFRFSSLSVAIGADLDFRTDFANKFFSLNGGSTSQAQFSTGRFFGDGNQASHWKDNMNLGIMDPTADFGEYGSISNLDVRGFDVIGWDVRMDYGDLPDTGLGTSANNYRTNLADNGPRHALFSSGGQNPFDPTGRPKVFLGTGVTQELAAQPNSTATGDVDNGIVFPQLFTSRTVFLSVTSTGGKLNYFFDFNADGDFLDSGESFSTSLAPGTQLVSVVIPANAVLETPTGARFRISTAGGLSSTGPADDGEVEDYLVTFHDPINQPPINVLPAAPTIQEDSSVVLTALRVTDVDAFSSPVLVALTAGNGTFSLSGIAGLSFGLGDGTNDTAMTFTGTLTAINAALNGLRFTPTPDFNGVATLTITTNDQGFTGLGGAKSDTDTLSINVTSVNDGPTNFLPFTQTAFSGSPLLFSAANGNQLMVADPDAGVNPLQVTLFVSNGTVSLGQTAGLSFTSGDGANDAVMTMTGTLADINAALEGASFRATAGFLGRATITVISNDNNPGGGARADTDSLDIDVRVGNQPPVNSLPGTQTAVAGQALVIGGAVGGAWFINGRQTSIIQNGGQLTFINEFGSTVQGRLLSSSQVIADGWNGLIGDIVGSNILWRNNSVWSRPAGTGISVSDPDGNSSNLLDVALTVTNGVLSLSGTAGLVFSSGDGTADGFMSFRGTAASINAALAGATFTAPETFSGTASVEILTNDLGNGGAAAQFDIDTLLINVTPAPAAAAPVSGDLALNLAGTWFINDLATTIQQQGTQLTFTNERGGQATGRVLSASQIIADSWGGLVGNLVSSGVTNTINWANNSTWLRAAPGTIFVTTPGAATFPTLSTNWTINGIATPRIQTTVDGLLFTNEFGNTVSGRFLSSTQVVATGWGDLIGTLNSSGTEIQWQNNSRWIDAAFAAF